MNNFEFDKINFFENIKNEEIENEKNNNNFLDDDNDIDR